MRLLPALRPKQPAARLAALAVSHYRPLARYGPAHHHLDLREQRQLHELKGATVNAINTSKILVVVSVVLFVLAVVFGHVADVDAHDLAYIGLACFGAAQLIP